MVAVTAERDAGVPVSSEEPGREPPVTVALWWLATLVAAFLAALVPLYFAPRFYFAGDTQSGAFGAWYKLGDELLAGRWPLMDPSHWSAGNYVVEGQYGLWNPVIWLIGVTAVGAGNAVVFSSVVKIAALVLGAGGGFLLIRTFGTRASTAALGGLAFTLTGFTVYMDAASWVTGLFVWSLWSYAWWGLRRSVLEGRNPLPAFVAGYLLVTVGYVHGTLLLAVTIAACIVEAMAARRWRSAIVATLMGLTTGLVAVTVHLPSLLSMGVTNRKSSIRPATSLAADGGDLLTAALATGAREIAVFGSYPTPMPLTYIAWFLPLLLFVQWSSVRRRRAEFVGLAVIAAVALAFILAPIVGPFRFPLRVMPYLASTVVIVAVVALDRGLVRRPGAARLAWAVAVSVVPAYLSWALAPGRWRVPLVSALLVAILVAMVWWWLGQDRGKGWRSFAYGRFVAACMVASVGFAVVQHHYVPRSDLREFRLPGDTDYYAGLLPDAVGDVMVIGQELPSAGRRSGASDEQRWDGFALANAWYVTGKPVAHTYTPVGFKAYGRRFCINFQGRTCDKALKSLFNRPEGMPVPRADLMSVSTVLIDKRGISADLRSEVPDGWEVASEDDRKLVWRRTDPLPPAGGPTYTSPGLELTDIRYDDRKATFTVDAVPSQGGDVVLSRLPWPGYSVTNAAFADPVSDYLLTVSVPPSSQGKTVTVAYQPPMWGLSKVSLAVSLVITVIASLLHALLVLRRRRGRVTSEEKTDAA